MQHKPLHRSDTTEIDSSNSVRSIKIFINRMSIKISGWDDTITALATPQGIGAIGVIRVSGKKTFEIVNKLYNCKDLSKQPSHTLHVGLLKYNDAVLDEVVISLFKAPKS